MDLNYCYYHFFLLIPISFISPLKYYGHSLQASLAYAPTSKPGEPRCLLWLCLQDAELRAAPPSGQRCGEQRGASTMGNLLAFEVGEVSQGLLCSWQSDCFLLGISCGLVFGVGGRMWSVYSTSSSRLISGDIHKR